MSSPSVYLDALVRRFSRLPGIGPRSASRIAFHILEMDDAEAEALARSILELRGHISRCTVCGGISDGPLCSVCNDSSRDRSVICVVQHPRDMLTIEGMGQFRGTYHVLGGLISPLDGVGPEDLSIAALELRCRQDVMEIILALNPTVEGDATSLYLARMFQDQGIRVSRIARGLPVGSDLEFADAATIAKSIEGRVII